LAWLGPPRLFPPPPVHEAVMSVSAAQAAMAARHLFMPPTDLWRLASSCLPQIRCCHSPWRLSLWCRTGHDPVHGRTVLCLPSAEGTRTRTEPARQEP
jgi:hypothetical protein